MDQETKDAFASLDSTLKNINDRLGKIECRLDNIEGDLKTVKTQVQELHTKTFRNAQDIKGIKQRH